MYKKSILLFILIITWSNLSIAQSENRITILYDAFGKSSNMIKDWGISALIEFNGQRILFDTGNDAEIFAHNIEIAGVDLLNLDFVIASHRHLDHTAGLDHLMNVNSAVKIYAPKESFGVFGSDLPSAFYRKKEDLPADFRYYDGKPPEKMTFGSAWPEGNFEYIDKTIEVLPGMHLISLVSDTPGTKELRELSLAIETAEGLVVIVGCSHPGVDLIVKEASKINKRIHLVLGGFHMPTSPDDKIKSVADTLMDKLQVQHLAPGHCTGEPAQDVFRDLWGSRYIYSGVGSIISLPN
jgi:7,8-dihydropterin-6-yl-methyl-4-(beta-D-ribofuranosyl)aminobenzene 5'-phosphate synthase